MLARPFLRLSARALNGVAVALGIGLIQLVVGALGGHAAAVAASSAAVCASLADVPNAPHRTRRRVLTAALIAVFIGLAVAVTQGHPVWQGVITALVAFGSGMMLAWGPRAGPVSFAGILAYVFTSATPVEDGLNGLLVHTGWALLGAAIYVPWSVAMAVLLRPRMRTLALADTIGASANLLRSRSRMLEQRGVDALQAVHDRIQDEAALDEQLQAARDLLFTPPGDDQARRHTALLLLAIDLRDTLLAGELDIDLLGADAIGTRTRQALASNLRHIAEALDAMQQSLREAKPCIDMPALGAALSGLDAVAVPESDPRSRLLPALSDRAHHMIDAVRRMQALMRGAVPEVSLQPAELQLFVSVEGWPLSALALHARLQSPVLRHALRLSAALTTAYVIGRLLPWSSHPYWLVLSVAVVLRGNLVETLARRNARVAGTVIGCLIVLILGLVHAPWFAILAFLTSIAIAHANVVTHYLVTSAAASVMALIQAHLATPDAGYAVPERLADTVLGALLAWGFSYVLPSWERRGLTRLIGRLLGALAQLSRHALQWPGPQADLALRLARREVYDALGSLATAVRRTRVEPERVRLPMETVGALLGNSHALLAQLAAIRLLLARRSQELSRPEAESALQSAAAEIERRLDAGTAPQPEALTPEADAMTLPAEPSAQALMPWLRRRLLLAAHSAARVAQAVQSLRR
ncbi:MAG TPA: FUSC family membrane protein [Burkholderiaceae bacterium]|nr:FUSC family membrane protein [Burkholderiaceae bacterium]